MTSISWASDELCLYRHDANCSHLAKNLQWAFFANFVKVLERVLRFPQHDLARSNKLRIIATMHWLWFVCKVQCSAFNKVVLKSVENLISLHVGSLWELSCRPACGQNWKLFCSFRIMTVAEKFIDQYKCLQERNTFDYYFCFIFCLFTHDYIVLR